MSIPRATYRVQLTADFGFDDAAQVVPYLKSLGISHLYASPFLKARAGSKHGYDIVDHNAINPELGGEDGLNRLSRALKDTGIGLILDFVPNHAAIHYADNAWWLDVLRRGRQSPHASAFDIDWNSDLVGPDRVLVPVLGRPYGEALEAGEIALKPDQDGNASVWYYDHRMPLDGSPAQGQNDKQTLHTLLERQHFRLAHWRLANAAINYRRFFDINTLAGLRVEEPMVFDAVHSKVGTLIADGVLQGLRLDHVDGLRDPAGYFLRLQRLRKDRGASDDFYVVMEKILGDGETLPDFPGVHGTTGYEYLNILSRLLLDESGLPFLDATWHSISEDTRSFDDILVEAKGQILSSILESEFTSLVRRLNHIASKDLYARDCAPRSVRNALQAFVVHFPFYRTYISDGVSPRDRQLISETMIKAASSLSAPDKIALGFLEQVLTLSPRQHETPDGKSEIREFISKLQQFTGPLAAKSLEDTAFYRFHRLLALNEVGGDPASSGLSLPAFHGAMMNRCRVDRFGLTATSTHDTKRGEDARMRILALAELPEEWEKKVTEWRHMNGRLPERPSAAHEYMIYQTLIGVWPFETHHGSFRERLTAYVIKAAREGKVETNWLEPNQAYESRLESFVSNLLDPSTSEPFLASFSAFSNRTAMLGALNSLSQLTLKTTIPGVPDFYQGSELWDLSLVDPDNRRPIDFAGRKASLQTASSAPKWSELIRRWQDGHIKLALTRRLLQLRHEFPRIFDGDYQPIDVVGPSSRNVVLFARYHERDAVIVAVGRHFGSNTDGGRRWPVASDWQGHLSLNQFACDEELISQTSLPPVAELGLQEIFRELPVAVIRARRKTQ